MKLYQFLSLSLVVASMLVSMVISSGIQPSNAQPVTELPTPTEIDLSTPAPVRRVFLPYVSK